MSQEPTEYKVTHGGARDGAGRKSKYEKTIVMRVPEKYRDTIKALIDHLDNSKMIGKHFNASVSDPVFIRSLEDKPQKVSFSVSPIERDKK